MRGSKNAQHEHEDERKRNGSQKLKSVREQADRTRAAGGDDILSEQETANVVDAAATAK